MNKLAKFSVQLAAFFFAVVLGSSVGWSSTGPTTNNCPVEPAQDTAIISGETYWGSNCVLNTIADVDSFQFNGSAGQTWTMVLGLGATANTQITLTLLAPNSSGGTNIFQGSTCTYCVSPGPPTYAVGTTVKLPISGTYTIVVTEASDAVQTYGLSLEEINPLPPDGIPLTLEQSVNGQVSPPTAQNAFTLKGSESGTYEIVVQLAPSPTQQVCLTTYDPTGKAVWSNCTCTYCVSPGPPTYSVTEYLTPPASGTYVLLVTEAGNDGTVGYNIEVSCYSGKCAKIPPKCLLTDKPTYDSSTDTVTMNFYLETPVAATWNGWLTTGNTTTQMWSQAQSATKGPIQVTMTQSSVSPSGDVGVLSTLTTITGGIKCSSWQPVETGTP